MWWGSGSGEGHILFIYFFFFFCGVCGGGGEEWFLDCFSKDKYNCFNDIFRYKQARARNRNFASWWPI